jgi:bacterioferritin-associated ferredoxin
MIICHCARVTDRDIRAAIEGGATSLSAVVKATGAGRCCAPCRDEIGNILGSTASERSADHASL